MGIVYVIRHGKAEKESPTGRDADRGLKKRGVRQAAWLGETLAGREARPEVVITSRFVRAIETARPVAAACDCELEEAVELESGRPCAPVIDLIERRSAEGVIAIVGHNPQLSDVVEEMVHGPETDGLWLRTGQACVLEVGGGEVRLLELLRLEE